MHRAVNFFYKKHINWLIFRIFLVELRLYLTNFMVDSISQLWFVVRRAKKSGWFMTGSYFGDNWICLDWYFSLASPVHNRVKSFVFRIWILLFYILVPPQQENQPLIFFKFFFYVLFPPQASWNTNLCGGDSSSSSVTSFLASHRLSTYSSTLIRRVKSNLNLLRDVAKKKRENVGIFPKWGTPPPPPLFGNDTFVWGKKSCFFLHFRGGLPC